MLQPFAIDADSIVHKIYHRHKGNVDEEEGYRQFVEAIFEIENKAKQRAWHQPGKPDIYTKILLSPKKTFRNKLTKEYKANRPKQSEWITNLKQMIYDRYKDKCYVNPEVEADDVIIHFMNDNAFWGAAIDKDILKATRRPVYNYNKKNWQEPDVVDISELWYIYQSLIGDKTDGIEGAPNIGDRKAKNFIEEWDDQPPYQEWVNFFESEKRAILMMRLVRMDQWKEETGVILWTPDKWKFSQTNINRQYGTDTNFIKGRGYV